MSVNDIEFGPDGYAKLIDHARQAGYVFDEPEAEDGKFILLRHDVDVSVAAAYELALLEKDLDVPSVYCLLPDSEMYNLLAPSTLAFVNYLVSNGFIPGLHVAPSCEISASVLHFLGSVTMFPDGGGTFPFSVHNPLLDTSGYGVIRTLEAFGNPNLSGARINSKIKYISDSGRVFREDPFALIDSGVSFQLLTHPEFWSYGEADSAIEALERSYLEQSLHAIAALEFAIGSMGDAIEARKDNDSKAWTRMMGQDSE